MNSKRKTSDWTHNNLIVDELPIEAEGFVYLITNTTNDRKYIGKKLAKFKTTKPPLKGKKNKFHLSPTVTVTNKESKLVITEY